MTETRGPMGPESPEFFSQGEDINHKILLIPFLKHLSSSWVSLDYNHRLPIHLSSIKYSEPL